jgi:hypothetical protein
MVRPFIFAVVLATAGRLTAAEPVNAYEVLQDKPINAGTIRDVYVRIPEPVTEEEIKRIASEIKGNSKHSCPKTSIFFLLPGEEPDKGAWARALYAPDLKISIFGVTVEQKKKIAAAPAPDGKVLGEWFLDFPGGLPHRITFVQRGKKVFALKSFADGSSREQELVPIGRTKFKDKATKQDEWMEISPQGFLEFRSPEGKAFAAALTANSPPIDKDALAAVAADQEIASLRGDIKRLEDEKSEAARQKDKDAVRRIGEKLKAVRADLSRLVRERDAKPVAGE